MESLTMFTLFIKKIIPTAIFFVFQFSFCLAQTIHPLTADAIYWGTVPASGNYGVWYHTTPGNSGQIIKPIIIASGIDFFETNPNLVTTIPFEFNELNTGLSLNLANRLLAKGYDIIILKYDHSGDYIQNNAMLLKTLITTINSEKANNGSSEKDVVVGISMGGLVARYSLSYMEQNNIIHDCKLFVSYDSPQTGANLPLGIQTWSNSLGFGMITQAADALGINTWNANSSQQMLAYFANSINGNPGDANPATLHNGFYSELNSLNSNSGYPTLTKNISISNGNKTGIGQPRIDGSTMVAGGVAFGYSSDNLMMSGFISSMPSNPPVSSAITLSHQADFFENSSIGINPGKPYDNCPGSFIPWFQYIGDAVLSSDPDADVQVILPNASFIPTTSALGIDNSNLFYNIDADDNSECDIPFNAYYAPVKENQFHVDLPTVNANWLFDQITSLENNNTVLINNVGFYDRSFNYGYNTNNIIFNNTLIEANGVLSVNKNTNTDYRFDQYTLSNSPHPPDQGSNFILKTPCKSGVEINVSDNGKILLGDIINNSVINTADLKIKSASSLSINNNGIVEINSGSILHIEDGGILNLNLDGTLLVHNNATVEIEYGGHFNYYDGAEIILEGNNSVLKINGKFYIGNNATFTFTGNGFIHIFSDWSNPNIICGTNASIVLEGANKYDKVLEIENSWLNPPDNLALFSIHNGKIEADYGTAINVGCPISLVNILMTKPEGNTDLYVHDGINVYGQSNAGNSSIEIKLAEIENGTSGLFVNSWANGVPVSIRSIQIHDCDHSLRSENSGLILNAIYLHDNNFGWEAFGMTLPSEADFLTSKFNNSDGVNYFGAETAPVSFTESDISNNQGNGVFESGNTICDFHCCTITNNTNSGINAVANATVMLGGGANNYIGNNYHGINLKFAKDLNLFKGGNYLINYPYDVVGLLENSSYCIHPYLATSNNQWNLSSTIPTSYQYNLKDICNSGMQSTVVNMAVNEILPKPFTQCEFSPNPKSLNDCADCRVITIDGVTESLNKHLEDFYYAIGADSSFNNKAVFNKIYSLLNLQNQNWNDNEKLYIRNAYGLLASAYGNAILSKQLTIPVTGQSDSSSVYFGKLTTINNHRENDNAFDKDSVTVFFDKIMSDATTMNITHSYDSASQVLNDLNSLSVLTYQKAKNHWTCVSDVRQMIEDSTIKREEFWDYFNACVSSFRLEDDDEFNITDDALKQSKLLVTVSPNPTSDNIKISLSNIHGTKINFEIYNSLGVKVFEKDYFAFGNLFCFDQSVKNLSSGNYLVHISDGIQSVTTNLNITK